MEASSGGKNIEEEGEEEEEEEEAEQQAPIQIEGAGAVKNGTETTVEMTTDGETWTSPC